MSGPSYRMHNPHSGQTLLYDLPSATPPTSPKSTGRIVSPTSPSFNAQSRSARSGRPTPPPSARMRSTTPLGFAPSELEQFAEYCQAWYFTQDDKAGTLMTQTLASLPPSQKASFSRVQASIRAAYHRSVSIRRHAEFQAHLAATQPGGSLPAHARADPRSPAARKERYDRLDKFIRNWCTTGLPGTKPFFEALWAVMRLQVIPQDLGGSGRSRIDWEFDDAVFKEAAGKEFMLEAIDVLKGVLSFEDAPSSTTLSFNNPKDVDLSALHARSQSQPLPSFAASARPKRARAPSDPFLDTPSASSRSPLPSHTPGFATPVEGRSSPFTGFGEEILANTSIAGDLAFDGEEETDYMRIWTSPDLTNPELLELIELFPSFVTRRPLPRFPAPPARLPDIEEGEDELEGKQIHFGTGAMWVSSKERGDGWDGSWWLRFVLWWRRMFSC
ncbi:hypothetical protein BKA70DRAFT_1383956 [Coprinopsis sp. MPI-PUGE-AT-0042]|nr:hypothetical protein BKA70DRAFT_1383956 [Coprinopsis sp. MPI-PUGE-AT-0042]